MRTIIYAIYDNKEKRRIYTSAHLCRVLTQMEGLDKTRYEIRHIWKSF
jgi:hypothetical protein